MIRELKKKRTKFGAIIAGFDTATNSTKESDNLEALHGFTGATFIHAQGLPSKDKGNGINWVGHRHPVKLRDALGHYIAQIRGGELIAFIRPDTILLEDASKLYDFIDSNRMERAYAFWVGPIEDPLVVGFNSSVVEFIFHEAPYSLMLNGDHMVWLAQAARKHMIGTRFFDANAIVSCGRVVPAPVPVPETIVAKVKKGISRLL